jgi:hypothetical protein
MVENELQAYLLCGFVKLVLECSYCTFDMNLFINVEIADTTCMYLLYEFVH